MLSTIKENQSNFLEIKLGDSQYPPKLLQSLGKKAPKSIFFLGNLELLNKAGVGFCGSRKASEKGLDTARDCAQQVSAAGFNVISGYAQGVDLETHFAALSSGGTTIMVLAEGIEHFRIKKLLAEFWDWNRVLVISQFRPETIWRGYQAMERNKTISALSHAMVLIEAREKSGTESAGIDTLKMGIPLFVAIYQESGEHLVGNKNLLTKGAKALAKSKTKQKANLLPLFDVIEKQPNFHGKSQLALL